MQRAIDTVTIDHYITTSKGRKVFYIDIGTCPPKKAEEHIKQLMAEKKLNTLIR